MIRMKMDASLQFSSKKMRKKRELENFEYITTIVETHWIQSCNCKDKIMNKEAI